MPNFSNLVPPKYKIGLGGLIYVLGGDASTGGNSPVELGDFVATNTALSKTTYGELFNNLTFNSSQEAITWTARTSGTTSNLLRVHYYNDQYVYCGFSGAFATSTNSSTWTTRSTGLTGILSEVVYGNGVYVVVAESPSGVASSTDAVTWTVRNGQTSTNLYSLLYGNGIFVYAGSNGALGTSTDGTTWSSVASGTTNGIGIAYGDGLFGRVEGSNFATSTDAVTWTVRYSGVSGTISGLSYGNGLWAIIGWSGLLITSINATIWNTRNTGTTAILRYLKYANGIWILTGNGGTLRTSTDTITWTARTAVNSLDTVGVTYSDRDGLYLYAAYGGTIAYSLSQISNPTSTEFNVSLSPVLKPTNIGSFNLSTYGKYYIKYKNTSYSNLPVGTVLGDSVFSNKWKLNLLDNTYVRSPGIYEKTTYTELHSRLGSYATAIIPPLSSQTSGTTSSIYRLIYGNGIYVYAGVGGVLRTSADVVTWTARTSGSTSTIHGLSYGNGIYVYVGDRGILRTSTDAVTWTDRRYSTTSLWATTYGSSNDTFVIAGTSGQLRTATSGGVASWTSRTSGTTSTIQTLLFANNLYVYGTLLGGLATSTDATTWTARTSGTASSIYALAYGNGIYVYAGFGGALATSTDAITWTARTSGTTSLIFALTYNNGLFTYAGNGGMIATSTDAITWTAISSGTTSTLRAATVNNNIYVYAGDGGVLLSGNVAGPTITASSFYNYTSHFIVPEVKHDSLASQFVYVKAKP